MKRNNRGMAYAILCITFVLLNVIVFAIPTIKTTTFWLAYVFTTIAFVIQIGIWKFAFKDGDTLKSKFLGIPLIHVGIEYLIIQVIALTVIMTFPIIPTWIAIIICAFILGVTAICLISAETGKEAIIRLEEKVSKKAFYIKSLQVDVEMLAESETDEEIKVSLYKLAENIRFSDPMSQEELTDIEDRISKKVKELQAIEKKAETIAEIELLLMERNKKVKILK